MKKIIIISLALLCSFAAFGQSNTVLKFEENAKGMKLFMYQSVIRMLNKDQNPEFNKLIKDLDHLRFVMTDSVGESSKNQFQSLDAGIRGEGFEEVMAFDNKDYRCHLFELTGDGGKSTWVAAMFMQGRAGIIEMKGSLNLQYINSLSSLNMDRLGAMLPLEDAGFKE